MNNLQFISSQSTVASTVIVSLICVALTMIMIRLRKIPKPNFLQCAQYGFLLQIKEYIEQQKDLNLQNTEKQTALILLAENRQKLPGSHFKCIEALLKAGVNFIHTDYRHRTALMYAAQNLWTEDFDASPTDAVKVLIDASKNHTYRHTYLNQRDIRNNTALTLASKVNNLAVVKMLRKNGAKDHFTQSLCMLWKICSRDITIPNMLQITAFLDCLITYTHNEAFEAHKQELIMTRENVERMRSQDVFNAQDVLTLFKIQSLNIPFTKEITKACSDLIKLKLEIMSRARLFINKDEQPYLKSMIIARPSATLSPPNTKEIPHEVKGKILEYAYNIPLTQHV